MDVCKNKVNCFPDPICMNTPKPHKLCRPGASYCYVDLDRRGSKVLAIEASNRRPSTLSLEDTDDR